MQLKIGIIMDPIENIHIAKDTSFALLLAAQARQASLYYIQPHQLYWANDTACANMQALQVWDDPQRWFQLETPIAQALDTLDVIWIRQDPPVNTDYLYMTYFCDHAEKKGVLVLNKPQSLRDCNEKFFITHFPQCCPRTIISSQNKTIKDLLSQEKECILKPLHGMGGESIFRVSIDDPNINVIIETLTQHGKTPIMAQQYLSEIQQGDKRILMIDGKPFPYALARMPQQGETRANLAAGGKGIGIALSARDQWICDQVGPTLQALGLLFVGIDIIGDYLTEINVTSPTCLRELDQLYHANIADDVYQIIERKITEARKHKQ